MMKWYCLIFFVFLFGCKTVEKTVSESREVKVVERDTVVTIAPDSVSIRAYLECDSMNNVILRRLDVVEGERLQVGASLCRDVALRRPNDVAKPRPYKGEDVVKPIQGVGAILSFDCNEDSLKKVIKCYDSIITTIRSTTQTQYIRRRNGYDRFVSCGFWILVVVTAGSIYIKIKTGRL